MPIPVQYLPEHDSMARVIKATPAQDFSQYTGYSPSVLKSFEWKMDYVLVDPETETQESILNGTALVRSRGFPKQEGKPVFEKFKNDERWSTRACLVYVVGRGYIVVDLAQWEELPDAEGWPVTHSQMLFKYPPYQHAHP